MRRSQVRFLFPAPRLESRLRRQRPDGTRNARPARVPGVFFLRARPPAAKVPRRRPAIAAYAAVQWPQWMRRLPSRRIETSGGRAATRRLRRVGRERLTHSPKPRLDVVVGRALRTRAALAKFGRHAGTGRPSTRSGFVPRPEPRPLPRLRGRGSSPDGNPPRCGDSSS